MADHVPANLAEVRQLFGFPHQFLQVVLAEVALPFSVGLADRGAGLGLRDREQTHLARRSSARPSRRRDTLPDALELFAHTGQISCPSRRVPWGRRPSSSAPRSPCAPSNYRRSKP